MTEKNKEYLPLSEIAIRLQINYNTLRNWQHLKEFPPYKRIPCRTKGHTCRGYLLGQVMVFAEERNHELASAAHFNRMAQQFIRRPALQK